MTIVTLATDQNLDPDKLSQTARRMLDGMIQDLLDSVKFQTGERLHLRLEEFDIQELVKEVHDQFSVPRGPRFQFIGNMAKGWWDREAMKRAIENIVGNAVKYGRPDTPIRIKTDSLNERLLLCAHNEGNSIPPEQVKDISGIP